MTKCISGTAPWKAMTQKISGITGSLTATYGSKYSWSINCWWADAIVSAVSVCPCDIVHFKIRCWQMGKNRAASKVKDSESASRWDWSDGLFSRSERNFSSCEDGQKVAAWGKGLIGVSYFNPVNKDIIVPSDCKQKWYKFSLSPVLNISFPSEGEH